MALEQLFKYCIDNGISAKKDELLKNHCTFKIGGPASLFIEPGSESEVKDVICAANALDVKLFILGNGSNILFLDKGFWGAVLHIGKSFGSLRLLDETTIEAGSGAQLKALCVFAGEHALSGLEFAYGIPGGVGGAIYMNAGAYGGEIKDVLISTEHINKTGEEGFFSGNELGLSYRSSVYSDGGFVITKGVFSLKKGDKDEITAKMNDIMGKRRDKQPLDMPSAGSTFKRPAAGYASALIDECGLKGTRIGGAMVSEKHAGFIVNAGGATCADVTGLIEKIKSEVMKKKGIELSCEVKVIE